MIVAKIDIYCMHVVPPEVFQWDWKIAAPQLLDVFMLRNRNPIEVRGRLGAIGSCSLLNILRLGQDPWFPYGRTRCSRT